MFFLWLTCIRQTADFYEKKSQRINNQLHLLGHIHAKKNILKSNSFDAMQTLFFAFTCKFGLVLHVEKVVICINKTNWHPLLLSDDSMLLDNSKFRVSIIKNTLCNFLTTNRNCKPNYKLTFIWLSAKVPYWRAIKCIHFMFYNIWLYSAWPFRAMNRSSPSSHRFSAI